MLIAEAEKYISPFVPFESHTKGLQRLENCFYFKKAAAELLLLSIVSPLFSSTNYVLSEHDLKMDNFHSNMDELFTRLKRLPVYFEKTAGDKLKFACCFATNVRETAQARSQPKFEV